MDTKTRKRPTLFDDLIDDIVFFLLKKCKRPQTTEKHLSDCFFMLSTKRASFDRYLFELHDHYVFCRKDEKHGELAFINILNAFLKKIGRAHV